MQIKEFQEKIRELYTGNDKKRGSARSFLYLVEEVGELAEALGEKGKKEVGDELADVVAWCCSIANTEGIDLEKEIIKKYGKLCPSCSKSPCVCKDKP